MASSRRIMPEIAVARLSGMDEIGGGAGRGEGRRDLAADVAGLAHPRDGHPARQVLDDRDGPARTGPPSPPRSASSSASSPSRSAARVRSAGGADQAPRPYARSPTGRAWGRGAAGGRGGHRHRVMSYRVGVGVGVGGLPYFVRRADDTSALPRAPSPARASAPVRDLEKVLRVVGFPDRPGEGDQVLARDPAPGRRRSPSGQAMRWPLALLERAHETRRLRAGCRACRCRARRSRARALATTSFPPAPGRRGSRR